jgi:hypothetical protein
MRLARRVKIRPFYPADQKNDIRKLDNTPNMPREWNNRWYFFDLQRFRDVTLARKSAIVTRYARY